MWQFNNLIKQIIVTPIWALLLFTVLFETIGNYQTIIKYVTLLAQ